MKKFAVAFTATFACAVLPLASTLAQERTAPFTAAEREAVYAASIDRRTTAILELLGLSNSARSNSVHGIIIAQYRALRARDEVMEAMLKALSTNAPGTETTRAAVLPILSKSLHDQFLARLSANLTPEQVEQVKDKMTYNKVKVTYDAYCEIVPKLTEAEKARILEVLKAAREEAMDGGSADEKSAIFQKHKDQINAYLNANGHDVAQATKEWEARQATAGNAPQ